MAFLKIVAVALVAHVISSVSCSGFLAPAIAPLPAALRYTHVAPPSVLPFSAQVNTFTRNLHVFDAPYAAGVLPGAPAIVQRALLPAPVAPLHPAPLAAPFLPGALPAPYAGYPYPAGLVARSLHAAAPPTAFAPALAPAPLLG